MKREYVRWFSPNLGRDMEMLVFGHSGRTVLFFPTSRGSFYECEDFGLIPALRDYIDAGRLQALTVDSIDSESWYNKSIHPHDRVTRANAYERYVCDEVVPYLGSIRPDLNPPRVVFSGASMGAFHAAVMGLRRPDVADGILSMSGMFDNSMFMDGYSDTDVYLTNPLAFLQGLDDPRYLNEYRRMAIVTVTGSADPNIEQARFFSGVLWSKEVPNTLDIWDGWSHDWPYWFAMARKYL